MLVNLASMAEVSAVQTILVWRRRRASNVAESSGNRRSASSATDPRVSTAMPPVEPAFTVPTDSNAVTAIAMEVYIMGVGRAGGLLYAA